VQAGELVMISTHQAKPTVSRTLTQISFIKFCLMERNDCSEALVAIDTSIQRFFYILFIL
jgi:hypothetical protein